VTFAELRPYQIRAIADARARFSEGAGSVVIVAPTGSGKSVLFAEIARRNIQQGGRVLVVAHRRELIKQAAGHLAKRGLDSIRTIVGGRALGPVGAPVTVAAIQSLTSKGWRDRLPPASLVIWDECHHIKAPSFMTVRSAYSDAKHIGLTATPQRADRSPLGDVFDSMVVVATVRELTDEGFLAPCDVWAPSTSRTKLAADAVEAYVDHGQNKRAIIFCANVVHAKDVADRLRAADVAAEYVDGTMPTRDRDEALARFASGATRVITNCSLISEGFDVPACKCIIIARGCDSVAMYLQAVGRALRPESSGERALLIDLRGAVHKHGMPDANRMFSLDGDAISLGDQVEPVKQCKKCGAVFKPVPACPACGAASPMPVPPAVKREMLQKISEAHTEDQRVEYWQRLLTEARSKGYKHGWAVYKFRARYGTLPPRAA
jgi:DNA repair protein RadD